MSTINYFKRGRIWWGRWTIDGHPFRKSSYTDDERLAKRKLSEEYAKSYKEVRLGEKPRRTWTETVDRYLEERQGLRTIKEYEAQRLWWDKKLKEHDLVYLDQITPDIVRIIRDEELARPKERGGGKRSPAAVNRKIALLRAVITAAHREYRWLDGEAPLYRMLSGEKERIRALKPEEVLRLESALPEGYAKLAKMAVVTGLRRRNVIKMRWDQIDLGARRLRVDGELMKNGEVLVIPLTQQAIDLLQECRNDSEWVFPLLDGKRPLNQIASTVWKKALEKAGISDLRWHDLRHTWATILRNRGVPTGALKELGGWKDARMVDRYAHLDVDHLTEHASVMDDVFGGGTERLRAVR